MLSSVDGRIDGAALKAVTVKGEYENTGGMLQGDAWICGRTTMQQHFADPESFVPSSHTPAGSKPVHVAKRAAVYAIAVDLLGEHFGIRRLLLEGGGHINGAFLAADLIDEVSLLVVPGIDGRHDLPAVFDGVSATRKAAVPLKLKSLERRENDTLWIRYEVVRP
jgi:riboflavin biosynthesis pyrimidine reductase